MSQYYGDSQWSGGAASQQPQQQQQQQPSTWDHQTPPPARSGASSTIPREESAAFTQQLEEVDRAIDNLVKSGKMFSAQPRHGRGPSGPAGMRPQSVGDFGGETRGSHNAHGQGHSHGHGGHGHGPSHGHSHGNSGPGLQNFYASQRQQSSRGSNEAEQMMQAKRRMAAQRERELRNYHQEQQYNRTVLAEMSYNGKPERALSPGNMSEEDRRDLIARQRSALYGDGPFEGTGGYADEAGAARPGLSSGPSSNRGPSPMAYEYGRAGAEGSTPSHETQGSRADSNPSPQSNPPGKGPFDSTVQQATRTSNSSPGGSPPRQGGVSGQAGNPVAPIGTRPTPTSQAPNPALSKRSTTPLPSPLSHGFSASLNAEEGAQATQNPAAPSNPPSAAPEGYNGWGNRSGVWGKQSSGLGVQASVWG